MIGARRPDKLPLNCHDHSLTESTTYKKLGRPRQSGASPLTPASVSALQRPLVILVLVLLVVLIGGFAAFLAAWDIPAPSAKIEKVIPNERFAR